MGKIFARSTIAVLSTLCLFAQLNGQDTLTVAHDSLVIIDSLDNVDSRDTTDLPVSVKRLKRTDAKPAHVLELQDDTYKTGNIADQMEGRVSGVQVSNHGGPDSEMLIRLRGIHTIHGHNRPLYVIDGMRMSHIRTVADLESIVNPHDIKSIEFLKDAFSTAQYGSEGANGVIVIRTR